MNRFTSALRTGTVAVASAALVFSASPAFASHGDDAPASVPQLERLDRGLVATTTSEGVFLSWRLLGSEATGSGDSGLTGATFAVYRGDERVAEVTDSTNFLDAGADGSASYSVAPVVNGVEGDRSAGVTPLTTGYATVPLQKPAGGVTPTGETYTYSAGDMSVGDMDGDGDYEYVVKWDPSNAKDNSQVGYTGNVYLDTYEADGTLLHRIDLGVNIRAGAHYTQFMVFDFDGDGRSEIMAKTAPGTRTLAGGGSAFITLPEDDVAAGVTHADDYRITKQGYFDSLVTLFEGWHEHPEVVAGNWPATLEEAWGIPVTHEYPLSTEAATELANHFVDVYAPSRSSRNVLRNVEGFVLSGPEYLTVFEGATGAELATEHYKPARGDDGLMWGDYAMSRIEPGNRNDRFIAGVAYLDGQHPSAIFARGYYTRSTIVAYDWDGEELTERWYVDSGHVPLTNPFNDGPHGRDGTDPEFGTITTQGFHSLSAADVDGDDKHEIVYGSATIDDDGSLLYSSFDTMPPQSATPGVEARLGHGDAMHVTDIDPARPGLEIFTVHEGGAYAPYGYALRDAATGEVIHGGYTGRDTGRGMVGDVRTDVPGLETWAVRLQTAQGADLGSRIPGTNQSIRWAADGSTQLVNGSGNQNVTIDDWTRGRLLTATDTRTSNGTKGNPGLVADVFGDWREELLVRTADSSELRIYFSTELTDRKLYTLMHDIQYRAEVARQNTTYNQPSYPGFYLASDMDWSQVPLLTTEVTPEAPVFTDKPGVPKDSFTIPEVDGVRYLLNGEAIEPGTYPGEKRAVTITAEPEEWWFFPADAETEWEYDFHPGKGPKR